MKGRKLRQVLEDLGHLVLRDEHGVRGFFVRTATGAPLGRYDLYEDGAYRHGWVENERGNGRTDYISWPEFYEHIAKRKSA